MKNGDMPVTPVVGSNGRIQAFTDDEGFSAMATGLTKREAFAMAAMQGLAAGDTDNRATHEDLAIGSVIMADALLKELSNVQNG